VEIREVGGGNKFYAVLMHLSDGFIQVVLQRKLSYGFYPSIMQRSNSRMVIRWVYPMGLSNGSYQ
jgi:hypothetical protein